MPLLKPRPVEEQPNLTLAHWRVRKLLTDGEHHLMGRVVENSGGCRVTSELRARSISHRCGALLRLAVCISCRASGARRLVRLGGMGARVSVDRRRCRRCLRRGLRRPSEASALMSTPAERMCALLNSRELLQELLQTPGLPDSVRASARHALRHYPLPGVLAASRPGVRSGSNPSRARAIALDSTVAMRIALTA
jgi:hypothetical protein